MTPSSEFESKNQNGIAKSKSEHTSKRSRSNLALDPSTVGFTGTREGIENQIRSETPVSPQIDINVDGIKDMKMRKSSREKFFIIL